MMRKHDVCDKYLCISCQHVRVCVCVCVYMYYRLSENAYYNVVGFDVVLPDN